MTTLYWITAAASLLGVWLNIHHRRVCFAIWAVTNGIWAAADWHAGLPQQAAVQAVYFALSLYGLWRWRTAPRAVADTAGAGR